MGNCFDLQYTGAWQLVASCVLGGPLGNFHFYLADKNLFSSKFTWSSFCFHYD